jgi:hypothetical protein
MSSVASGTSQELEGQLASLSHATDMLSWAVSSCHWIVSPSHLNFSLWLLTASKCLKQTPAM